MFSLWLWHIFEGECPRGKWYRLLVQANRVLIVHGNVHTSYLTTRANSHRIETMSIITFHINWYHTYHFVWKKYGECLRLHNWSSTLSSCTGFVIFFSSPINNERLLRIISTGVYFLIWSLFEWYDSRGQDKMLLQPAKHFPIFRSIDWIEFSWTNTRVDCQMKN